jgi:hypothetical protein
MSDSSVLAHLVSALVLAQVFLHAAVPGVRKLPNDALDQWLLIRFSLLFEGKKGAVDLLDEVVCLRGKSVPFRKTASFVGGHRASLKRPETLRFAAESRCLQQFARVDGNPTLSVEAAERGSLFRSGGHR